MKNSQKGFIVPGLLAVIVLIVIGGGYVYENRTGNNLSDAPNLSPVLPSAASCGDFAALSDYVLNNIQQPDSQNMIQANKNVIPSIRWKRHSDEPFVSYPIINGVQAYYGNQQAARSHDFVVSAIKNNSDALEKIIDEKVKSLGLSADALNTLPFRSFPDQDIYLRTFAYRKADNLYSIILKAEGGVHQAPPTGVVTVVCGTTVAQYDNVYSALNLKSDSSVQDGYDNDYVAIADVSPDNNVFALLGSSNHIKVADYYFYDGSAAKLVSKDSYPAECATLESQMVGKGMRCVGQYSQRQPVVSYTSSSPDEVPNIIKHISTDPETGSQKPENDAQAVGQARRDVQSGKLSWFKDPLEVSKKYGIRFGIGAGAQYALEQKATMGEGSGSWHSTVLATYNSRSYRIALIAEPGEPLLWVINAVTDIQQENKLRVTYFSAASTYDNDGVSHQDIVSRFGDGTTMYYLNVKNPVVTFYLNQPTNPSTVDSGSIVVKVNGTVLSGATANLVVGQRVSQGPVYAVQVDLSGVANLSNYTGQNVQIILTDKIKDIYGNSLQQCNRAFNKGECITDISGQKIKVFGAELKLYSI